MAFNTGAALLDALVLSIVSNESTYGYKITQEVRSVMSMSESTLYPVLRRLQKDEYLETAATTALRKRGASGWHNTAKSGSNIAGISIN